LLTVPLMQAGLVRPLMVSAGQLDRLQHALEPQLLDALSGKVQVFEAPADLLARQRLVAQLPLRGAEGLRADQRVDQSAIVENLRESILADALALREHVLLDIRVHAELASRMLQQERLVALGLITRRDDIRLSARPPHANDLVTRICNGSGFLD